MADWNQDIGAYLKNETRCFTAFFVIFPDWTPPDYEEVCSRIQKAFVEVGLAFNGHIPRITVRNGRVAPSLGYHQRIAAEKLLFGRYNQDGLLSLPHQKDPSRPRPSWFRDYMLVPGPHSLGQKLLAITETEEQSHLTADVHHGHHQRLFQAESEDTVTPQHATNTVSAGAEERIDAIEQSPPSDTVRSIESQPMQDGATSKPFEDLTVHIRNILELENGQIVMRRTLRDPQSWLESSETGTFDFQKVRRSVGVPAAWDKELFFFPDVTKDPHSVLDEEELLGAIQHLYKQSAKEHRIKSISIFVASDIDHVRALSLDQRDLSKQAVQTVTICPSNH